MKDVKYAVMGCSREITNVGDFVQSIAGKQYLPKVDMYMDRDLDLKKYEGEKVKMIMNGWYMHQPENWPPSDDIDPLLLSMHINASVYDSMTSSESLAYFKKHEPIGCRDKGTMKILNKNGVDAYFSGCLTLTLGKSYKREEKNITDEVLFVDPLFHYWSLKTMLSDLKKLGARIKKRRFAEFLLKKKVLRENFTTEVLEKAQYIDQTIPRTTVEDNFRIADEYLKRLCNAKLVVTSRIHCALPCLAMGTPVVFLNGGFGGNNNRFNSRFEGLIDFFNRIDIDDNTNVISRNFDLKGKIGLDNLPTNKTLHIPYAKDLVEKCEQFVTNFQN
ncbi:Polysaccharide pyruvyl transferase [Sinomicrobium oceani]|uniref:Polysaccharide pyruvyl transferase n=1 Tax=Sinomicrobium oceani TaxID=1150368 RepID=A0A1K1QZJ0_9FLAO|nr:polysaccharide pyruvyl transferase family protein [Sinomicrobium oceani]SFW65304.1 Polysaccharide pyruvyl transferase [Sinomicrobium oceani]